MCQIAFSIPSAVFWEVTAKEDSACALIRSAGDWIYVEQIYDYGAFMDPFSILPFMECRHRVQSILQI